MQIPKPSLGQQSVPPPTWFIALTIAAGLIGMTLLIPALPMVQQDLAESSQSVQQLLTAYLVALALGQLLFGTVSDRTGRRPVLLFGALLYAVGGAIATASDNIESLIVCRFIQGFGSAGCLSMGRAIVNDCYERNDAARNMSMISSMIALAPVLSIALGGVIAQAVGWKGILLATSLAGFLVFILALVLLPETNRQRTPSIELKTVLTAYSTVLKNKIFVFFALTSGMQIGMFFAMGGFMPYQYQRLGYTAVEFGFWFSLTSVFFLIGNLVNRHYLIARGIERAAMIGCVLSLLSLLALLTTQTLEWRHALALALPCCLFGFSNGIVNSNTTVGAMSAAGRHAGTGSGLAGAWQMASGGIAGALIVEMGGAENFQLAVGGLLLMSVASVLSMRYVYRRRKSH